MNVWAGVRTDKREGGRQGAQPSGAMLGGVAVPGRAPLEQGGQKPKAPSGSVRPNGAVGFRKKIVCRKAPERARAFPLPEPAT